MKLSGIWRKFLQILPRSADGWYLNAAALTPDVPEWGPYASRGEAVEARESYLRCAISKPWLDCK